MTPETLVLTEDLFIGRGMNKEAYRHPLDPGLCVKVLRRHPNPDMRRELRCRRARERRGESSELLPRYYGPVPTNLGRGYIFELVRDYDGQPSPNLKSCLEAPPGSELRFTPEELVDMLRRFRDEWAREKIVTSDAYPGNFVAQRLSPGERRMRIIDNIGSPALIPLADWFVRFAERRLPRYWQRLLKKLRRDYPELVSQEMAEELRWQEEAAPGR